MYPLVFLLLTHSPLKHCCTHPTPHVPISHLPYPLLFVLGLPLSQPSSHMLDNTWRLSRKVLGKPQSIGRELWLVPAPS